MTSYLIAMGVTDFSEISRDDVLDAYEDMEEDAGLLIPHPRNEPVIGVIDNTVQLKKCNFHEWV